MATIDAEPAQTGGGSGLTPEQIMEMFGSGAEAQIEAARIGADALLENTRLGQQFVREGADKASALYQPFIEGGKKWGARLTGLWNQGAPKFEWGREFRYDPWQYDKQFSYQGFPEYAKDRFTQEGIKDSPYYGLYQFQRQQQQDQIQKQLRSRGLYGSGSGMAQELAAGTGMDQKFMADEYGRTLSEYGMGYDQAMQKYMLDYEQALQKHNIGYEEAKQQYGMDFETYLKKFGSDYGSYMDQMNRAQQLSQYQWLASQGIANAQFGAGSQMGNMTQQTGQALAGLQSNLGQGLASTYNAQGNTMANMYNSSQNRTLGYAGLNQAQNNWNTANSTNMGLGAANLAVGAGRAGLDAYRYYNPASTGYPTIGGVSPATSYYPDGGNNWTYLD